MGTRHMIGVVLGGEFRVGQYGQWDGYPSGQGEEVLNFLRDTDIEVFKEKVRKLRWITEPEIAAVNADENWHMRYPYLSRDASATVLSMIMADEVLFLQDQHDFALDSLFCEWAYVVDLDLGTFEVYEGFQKTPPKKGLWFGQKDKSSDYYPVELVRLYSLKNLPTVEQFLAELEPGDSEE